jgi:hypothetical protein
LLVGKSAKMILGLRPNPLQKQEELLHMKTKVSTQKAAPQRSRPVQMIVRMSQEEKDYVMKKMEASGLRNFNLYALKMLIVGKVINVDLTHYHELAKEVSRIGANINQIVRAVNSTGRIFESEVAGLQQRMEEIWQLLKSNLSTLQSKNL